MARRAAVVWAAMLILVSAGAQAQTGSGAQAQTGRVHAHRQRDGRLNPLGESGRCDARAVFVGGAELLLQQEGVDPGARAVSDAERSQAGAQDEYQVGTWRHWSRGSAATTPRMSTAKSFAWGWAGYG